MVGLGIISWRIYSIGKSSICLGECIGWGEAVHAMVKSMWVKNPALPHYSSEALGKKQTSLCLSFFVCEIEINYLTVIELF